MPVNNGRSTATQRGAKRIYENIFDRYTDKKYMYVYIYINTFPPAYLHTYPYMYIRTITHVNITNYLEISFQSVSERLGVGPAAAAAARRPVATGLNRLRSGQLEPVGNSRNQQKKNEKKKPKKNSRNKSESGGTSRNRSVRTFFLFFFFLA